MPATTSPLSDIYVKKLPAVAQDLVLAIGMSATLKLIRRYGGASIRVPRGHKSSLRPVLDDLLGEDACAALCKFYGGGTVYVPRCAAALQSIRDAAIITEAEQRCRTESMTGIVQDMACRYGLSDRRVWEIMKTPST